MCTMHPSIHPFIHPSIHSCFHFFVQAHDSFSLSIHEMIMYVCVINLQHQIHRTRFKQVLFYFYAGRNQLLSMSPSKKAQHFCDYSNLICRFIPSCLRHLGFKRLRGYMHPTKTNFQAPILISCGHSNFRT